MRKIVLLFCLFATLMASGRRLTLMSYNVRNGCGLDGIRNHARTAAVIKEQNPDVVAIQEVDSMTARSGRQFVLADLAGRTGMEYTFAPAIDFDGGRYGIGILSREKPLSVARYALPGREEKRALVVAEFADYYYACTHLSLTEEDCLASVALIEKVAAGADKPFFIAGDFNATPDSEVIRRLGETFQILSDTRRPTFPADSPEETIDYIMVLRCSGNTTKVKQAKVVEAPEASDHRPILVKVNSK